MVTIATEVEIVDAPNGTELMAQLSTQEVYLLAVERGPEHLPELLSLATPEQWSGFIDLRASDVSTLSSPGSLYPATGTTETGAIFFIIGIERIA